MLDRLERRRKRNSWSGGGKDRKVFRGNSNSMSRMLNDNKKRQGRERIVLYEKGLNDDVSSSIDKVEVSQQTMEALKSEAEILFPTSVQALATAWKQSDLVMRWHDDESQSQSQLQSSVPYGGHNSNSNKHKLILSELLGRSLSLKPTQLQLQSQSQSSRRQLQFALNQLVTSVGSLDQQVNSWKEAIVILAKVIHIPKQDKLTNKFIRISQCVHQKFKEEKASLQSYMKQVTTVARQRGFISDIENWSQFNHISTPQKNNAKTPLSAVVLIENLLESKITEQKRTKLHLQEQNKKQLNKARIIAKQDAKRLAHSLLRPFTDQENNLVKHAMYKIGSPEDILATDEGDQVSRLSLQTLQPGQWLNDEVIHYFYKMMANRDAKNNKNNNKRCHFFKSFFLTKLLDEGATNKYRYANVKRWSKRVPGKDIFNLDKIFFPVNVGNVHWACAVIFMTKKRIVFYDSMGGGAVAGKYVLQALKKYLQDEWQDKKGGPTMPNIQDWELIPNQRDKVPQQRNGYDCGVYACMFADFISRDVPLLFSQTHITECRKRIALSILTGTAIE